MTDNRLEDMDDGSPLPQFVIHSPLDCYLVHNRSLIQMESTSDN